MSSRCLGVGNSMVDSIQKSNSVREKKSSHPDFLVALLCKLFAKTFDFLDSMSRNFLRDCFYSKS